MAASPSSSGGGAPDIKMRSESAALVVDAESGQRDGQFPVAPASVNLEEAVGERESFCPQVSEVHPEFACETINLKARLIKREAGPVEHDEVDGNLFEDAARWSSENRHQPATVDVPVSPTAAGHETAETNVDMQGVEAADRQLILRRLAVASASALI
jgi:hypothetical protein